ncbi:hypothetical protein RFI_30980, partial [Reticulomyxa filosa]
MDAICEKVSFVFIMDGFDEIFDKYKQNNNDKYFYNRFHLNQWNADVIVTCRSNLLNDDDINTTLIGVNKNQSTVTSMMYLWPFTRQQIHYYIDNFATMKSKNNIKNKNNDWTAKQYEERLNNYPTLQKMAEEPFLLQFILSVLPSLVKQYGIGSRISKAQVYEVFNDQWIDIHAQDIKLSLEKLRIQMNMNKIKSTLNQYCLDLGLDMFIEGNSIAVESDFQNENKDEIIWNKLEPKIESENKNNIVDEKSETKTINETTDNVWEKYFNGNNIAKCVLRRVGENKYQFLHKSCQTYYAAQKIIFDIISWKSNVISDINNQQFQQQFEPHAQQLLINRKLLNEEMEIVQFIADRIYDDNFIFANLKSRLFRIIESSKSNSKVSIAAANAATILNVARVSMSHQNWDKINIPHAILDHAFLEGSSFKDAILDNVSFFRACLNYTNFTNASVNQVNFGEYGNLKGHSDAVTSVQFSPDGNRIVSGSRDNTIRLWDASSGKQIQCLKGHSDAVTFVQFSPDGNRI